MAVDNAGEIVEYKGEQAKVLKNGALQSLTTGRLLTAPAVEYRPEPLRTSEDAQRLNNLRWHAPRQAAAVQAVREASGDGSIDTIEAADAYMLRAMIQEVVLDSDTPGRDRVVAWKEVNKQMGTDASVQEQAPTSAGLSMSNDVAQHLLSIIEQANARRNG